MAAGISVDVLAERRLASVPRRRRVVFSLGEMRRRATYRGMMS